MKTPVTSNQNWPATFFLLAATLSFLTLQSPHLARADDTTQPDAPAAQTFKVHTIDTDGTPIPNVNIHASVWTNEPFKHNRDYTTDATGTATVQLPATMEIFRIWTKKSSYVPTFTHWEHDWLSAAGNSVPTEITITLKKGTTIGGFIKNENDVPIAGAKIGVTASINNPPSNQTGPDDNFADGDDDAVTDANGHWTLDNIPDDPDLQLQLSVTHPDYISDLKWGDLQKSQNITTDDLRKQTAAIVMHRGTSLTGLIVDPQGNPIPNAVVIWGDDPYMETATHQEHRQEVLTDANGTYHLQPLSPMPLTITVVAKGWMPQLKKTAISPDNTQPQLDFQLKLGKTLRLRFTDASGNPLPGVGVGITGWQSCKSLYNYEHPIVLDTQIPRFSDATGLYEWTWAPDDAVTCQFYKKGYGIITKSLTAADSEQSIQLDR